MRLDFAVSLYIVHVAFPAYVASPDFPSVSS